MSQKPTSNSPTPPADKETQTTQTQTVPATETVEAKTEAPEAKTETNQPTLTEPSIPVSQVESLIDKAVSKALAARDEQDAKKAKLTGAGTATTEPATVSPAVETPVVSTPDGPLYGNRDKKKEFDLRTMTTIKELPTDKTIVVLPEYMRDSAGNPTGYDYKRCRVQFLDPVAHENRQKTDNKTGASTYSLLGIELITIHVPA